MTEKDLKAYRVEMDAIDERLISAFTDRMKLSQEIANYKKDHDLPILDTGRERSKLAAITEKCSEEMRSYGSVLYSLLFELSRSYQGKLIHPTSPLMHEINDAIENTDKLFPQYALVACQGVEGAYSQQACEKIFQLPNIMYMSTFEGVFSAINSGLCQYGILPIENSTAGSVHDVYDLLMANNCRIVRSTRLKIDHCLLGKRGTKLEDIKEIYSHEQAINQCQAFLKSMPKVKVHVCENTAMAAKMVSESDRKDVAALSSRTCADLYNLGIIKHAVQDNGNNYTRFICISKNMEIYPGADKTSIMMVISHKPGSLYKVLSRFFALGINLVKLESRPIPERDFEFMFYFDLDTPIYSQQFIQLICELDGLCEEFRYLGSYSEVI